MPAAAVGRCFFRFQRSPTVAALRVRLLLSSVWCTSKLLYRLAAIEVNGGREPLVCNIVFVEQPRVEVVERCPPSTQQRVEANDGMTFFLADASSKDNERLGFHVCNGTKINKIG